MADHPLVDRSERMLAHSDRLVLASTTAPASRSRVTSGASAAGRPIERGGAGGAGQPGHFDVVLHHDRHAVERPPELAAGPLGVPLGGHKSRASAAMAAMARSPTIRPGRRCTAIRPSECVDQGDAGERPDFHPSDEIGDTRGSRGRPRRDGDRSPSTQGRQPDRVETRDGPVPGRLSRLVCVSVRRVCLALGAILLLVTVVVTVKGPAAPAAAASPATCGGTVAAPHALAAGTYGSLDVTGVCDISAGQVVVTGNVTVEAGAALVSAYGWADGAPGTHSGLTVGGDLTAAPGSALVLGCEPTHFDCLDDPDPSTPTLTSVTTIGGNLTAADPLGVILHQTTINGDFQSAGGGGGRDVREHGGRQCLLRPPRQRRFRLLGHRGFDDRGQSVAHRPDIVLVRRLPRHDRRQRHVLRTHLHGLRLDRDPEQRGAREHDLSERRPASPVR